MSSCVFVPEFAPRGETVPKEPLWETFRSEKPKVFWAFVGVQIPSAPVDTENLIRGDGRVGL